MKLLGASFLVLVFTLNPSSVLCDFARKPLVFRHCVKNGGYCGTGVYCCESLDCIEGKCVTRGDGIAMLTKRDQNQRRIKKNNKKNMKCGHKGARCKKNIDCCGGIICAGRAFRKRRCKHCYAANKKCSRHDECCRGMTCVFAGQGEKRCRVKNNQYEDIIFSPQDVSERDLKDWLTKNVMDDVVDAIEETETTYVNPDNDMDKVLDRVVQFMTDKAPIDENDFVGLMVELDFDYSYRRHLQENRALGELSDDCLSALLELTVDIVATAIFVTGLKLKEAKTFVRALIKNKSTQQQGALLRQLKSALATQWAIAAGDIKAYAKSGIITFFKDLEITWGDLVETIRSLDFDFWFSFGYSLLKEIALIFASEGAIIAVRVLDAIQYALILYVDSKAFLDECFGETISKPVPCDNFAQSGGAGVYWSAIEMGATSGTVHLYYEMYDIKDEIEVFYEDERVHWSGGLVSDHHEVDIPYSGRSSYFKVRITAPTEGTEWNYKVSCPICEYDFASIRATLNTLDVKSTPEDGPVTDYEEWLVDASINFLSTTPAFRTESRFEVFVPEQQASSHALDKNLELYFSPSALAANKAIDYSLWFDGDEIDWHKPKDDVIPRATVLTTYQPDRELDKYACASADGRSYCIDVHIVESSVKVQCPCTKPWHECCPAGTRSCGDGTCIPEASAGGGVGCCSNERPCADGTCVARVSGTCPEDDRRNCGDGVCHPDETKDDCPADC